jgi:hypothetical protein
VTGGSRVGPASEKKSLHATERDTEENRSRREVFLDQLRSTAPEQLIFLDESGVSTQMTRRYARARAVFMCMRPRRRGTGRS